ncbi:hypothetical protein [Seonamhaeicola sp. ML3]|uniref:hypothetical protein n=1 Tax=Seonamhaeicola sp. ML3 TaxID=2937786 RepID=UPI002010658A|nr:hypothetical protein [Seonamhaeicola sp. ML3]
MKTLKTSIFIIVLGLSISTFAQESQKDSTHVDKTSYYQKRAHEDAKFEQHFVAENESEEKEFWSEQKAYERDLKKRDKKAYKAYMQGKKDAYAEHYEHCNNHCHHSDHYYHHATFYYYRYDGYYNRYPSRGSSINTNIRLNAPNVRVGLF